MRSSKKSRVQKCTYDGDTANLPRESRLLVDIDAAERLFPTYFRNRVTTRASNRQPEPKPA